MVIDQLLSLQLGSWLAPPVFQQPFAYHQQQTHSQAHAFDQQNAASDHEHQGLPLHAQSQRSSVSNAVRASIQMSSFICLYSPLVDSSSRTVHSSTGGIRFFRHSNGRPVRLPFGTSRPNDVSHFLLFITSLRICSCAI